jgi:hypothetical protein
MASIHQIRREAMNYSTGPPDWYRAITFAAYTTMLAGAVYPIVYVNGELSVTNPFAIVISNLV